MELNQLKIFCAIVEKRSFSKAGEAVFLSQPTVSLQIKSLEQKLGTRLLDRQGREVTITKSGEALYSYAQKILHLVDEARQSIEQLKGLIRGEITIGASTIPGEYILPGILAEFKGNYPGIEINLVIDDTKGITQKVIDNDVDLGVVGTRERGDALLFTPFTREGLVLIDPSASRWFRGKRATMEELKKIPFIIRERGSGTRASLQQKFHEAGFKETDFHIAMTAGSTAAVKKAVESGAGVSFVSEKAIVNEIKLGLVKKITVQGLELDREFFIVSRRQKSHSPSAKALMQFLKEKRDSL